MKRSGIGLGRSAPARSPHAREHHCHSARMLSTSRGLRWRSALSRCALGAHRGPYVCARRQCPRCQRRHFCFAYRDGAIVRACMGRTNGPDKPPRLVRWSRGWRLWCRNARRLERTPRALTIHGRYWHEHWSTCCTLCIPRLRVRRPTICASIKSTCANCSRTAEPGLWPAMPGYPHHRDILSAPR